MSLVVLATLLLAGTPAGAYEATVAPSTPGAMAAPAATSTATPTSTAMPSAPSVVVVPVPAPLPVSSPASPATSAAPSGPRAAARQKLRLGDQLLAEGDTRMALFAYQDAVNQDPQSAEARVKLGRAYLLLGHPDEALEQFGVAAALDPGMAEAREALERARSGRRRDVPPPGSPVVARMPEGAEPEPVAEVPPAPPPLRP